jgi:multidrug efflux pump subunit AcrB
VAAFSPMMMINNELGKVLASFSGVVILALLFSLFDSKFILPAYLANIKTDNTPSASKIGICWKEFQHFAQGRLYTFRDKIYAPALKTAIYHRYAVVIGFLAVAVLGIGLVELGKVRTVFFPEVPGQIIRINMEMDARAPYNLTVSHINKIDAIREELNKEYVKSGRSETPPIAHILKIVTDASSAEIYAELIPSVQRPNLETMRIVKDWQKRTGNLEGTNSLTFSGSDDVGSGFSIQLFSKDEEMLKQASAELIAFLNKIDGVRNLRDELKGGQPEIHFTIVPQAQHLGFSTEDIARQLGARFGGLEVQRIQRDNREVKVMIKNDAQARKTLQDLMETRLKGIDGHFYPLLSVARFESNYTNTSIARWNGKRVNTIQAFVDKDIVSSDEIWQSVEQNLLPKFKEKYPTVALKTGGELEEMATMKGGLKRALFITALLIYVLMAIPLKSYIQPVVIMAVIPFGFIGATLGHLIMTVPLSLLSFFGMLALTGVVVNDSLVMLTRYNQARGEGEDIHDALITCGVSRFQAIFLTTVTTVAGLMPLLSETSEQAQYLIPAAISLAYGEIFTTAITLILIPVMIAIHADMMRVFTQPEKAT